MQFGYTILYVDDVPKTLEFYRSAFNVQIKMQQAEYGELSTGATTLSFAARSLADQHLPVPAQESSLTGAPFPMEIAFVTDDVQAAYHRAIAAGALPVHPPSPRPWGQMVSYVRDCNGFLVEICSPVG